MSEQGEASQLQLVYYSFEIREVGVRVVVEARIPVTVTPPTLIESHEVIILAE
jgi:hypothetical protein